MDVNAAMTAQRWPGAPTSPIVAAWPIEVPYLQFQIHGSPDGVAAIHLLKVDTALPPLRAPRCTPALAKAKCPACVPLLYHFNMRPYHIEAPILPV